MVYEFSSSLLFADGDILLYMPVSKLVISLKN